MPVFDPADFFTLAQALITDSSSEASVRSAIGRAYYACYLTARDELYGIDATRLTNSEKKRLVPKSPSVHGAVRVAVATNRNLKPGKAKRLADQLSQLFELRKLADYERDSLGPGITQGFGAHGVSDWAGLSHQAMSIAANLLPELRQLRP